MNKDYFVQLNIQDDFDKHIGVVKLNETDSVTLNINLVQNGTPFDLTIANYVTVAVIKPDQSFNNGYCEIVDGPAGKIKYTLPTNCVNQTGVFRGEVQAFNNTSMISTAAFSYEVKNSLLRDEGVTTQPEYPILVLLIDQVQGALTAETGRVSAESGRVTAESNRVTAESGRVSAESTRASNESTRQSKETSRVSAESSRVTAETGRVSAEAARVAAENARATAETTRQSNESTRQTQENTRKTDETNRKSAETARASAESVRSTAETTRNNSEAARLSAESTRISSENIRVDHETDRISAESTRVTNENVRVSNETNRVNSENARIAAENARATAETNRATAESSRVTAESARVTAENTRVSKETTRQSNESTRQTQESNRVSSFATIYQQYLDSISSQTNIEVVDARTSTKLSTTYPNLKTRLEKIEEELFPSPMASLALTATEQIKSVTDSYESPADITAGGATLYQAVVNGDFANGTTGWSSSGATLSATDKILSVSGNGVSSAPNVLGGNNGGRFASGTKMFAKTRVKLPLGCTSVNFNHRDTTSGITASIKAITNPVVESYIDLYNIYTISMESVFPRWQIIFGFADSATANGKVMEIEGDYTKGGGVFVIPLTDTPYESYTADQLNAMVNTYWEGLQASRDLTVVGRGLNLFDGELEIGNINTTNGTNFAALNVIRSKNYQEIKSSTVYNNYATSEYTTSLCFFYDENKNWISFATTQPATSPPNAKYYRFRFRRDDSANIQNSDIENSKPMLVEGSTVQPYQPANFSTATISSTRHKLPNLTEDTTVLKDGAWSHNKRCQEYTLVSGDMDTLNTTAGNFDYVGIKKTSLVNSITWANTTISNSVIVSGFGKEIATPIPDDSSSHYTIATITDKLLLIVPKGTYPNLAAAQAALTGTKIIYQLATPLVIEEKDFDKNGITVSGMIGTNEGYTNLYMESSDLTPTVSIEYALNAGAAIGNIKDVAENNTEAIQRHETRIDGISNGSATDIPTTGTWKKGDKVWNSNPDAGEFLGWVCVVEGTPGTWKGFGLIQS